jgi:hypothetical protein
MKDVRIKEIIEVRQTMQYLLERMKTMPVSVDDLRLYWILTLSLRITKNHSAFPNITSNKKL